AKDSGKEKALEETLKKLEKQFGKGSIMKLGERPEQKISVVSSGSIGLDIALGVGGYPKGRITEIYGPESSGKTTLALHAIAEVQKQGGKALFIDVEHTLDPVYAQKLGVNIDEVLVSQPNTGEEALEVAEEVVRTGAVEIVVIDSVAALVPQAEIDGEMGDSHMGLQARLMSQALRKLSGHISRQNVIVIFLNQIREKIGCTFITNNETTPGGRALKFYSTIRIDVRRRDQIKNSKVSQPTGNITELKVVKNKVAPPFKNCKVDILYGEGISKEGEVLNLGIELGLVEKGGSWHSYNKESLGQGVEKVKQFLKENKQISHEIEQGIRSHYVNESKG
uniref:recombinase RecA n=1 Tax=Bacillus albus TaxID=2026189 RepID=UPI001021D8C2